MPKLEYCRFRKYDNGNEWLRKRRVNRSRTVNVILSVSSHTWSLLVCNMVMLIVMCQSNLQIRRLKGLQNRTRTPLFYPTSGKQGGPRIHCSLMRSVRKSPPPSMLLKQRQSVVRDITRKPICRWTLEHERVERENQGTHSIISPYYDMVSTDSCPINK